MIVPDEELDYYLLFGGPSRLPRPVPRACRRPSPPAALGLGAWMSTGCHVFSEEDVRALCSSARRRRHALRRASTSMRTGRRLADGQTSDGTQDRFPDPAALLAEVTAAGLRPCLWINPYIGVESPAFRRRRQGRLLPQASRWALPMSARSGALIIPPWR